MAFIVSDGVTEITRSDTASGNRSGRTGRASARLTPE